MAGHIGLLDPYKLEQATPHRLRVDVSKDIDKLNLDESILMRLLDSIGKEEAKQMTFHWLTKERIDEWTDIHSFGGSWASGANKNGTINVPNTEAYKFAPGDIVRAVGTATTALSEVNLFITEVGAADSGGSGYTSLVCMTYDDDTTVNFSGASSSTKGLQWIGNSFELGTGMGTIKSSQPVENKNYIQVIQTPYGSLEPTDKIEYDAGGKESAENEEEAKILHQYTKELTAFFGQKHMATVGYQNKQYMQGFTGGLLEAIDTNVATLASPNTLTRADWGAWINQSIRYAKTPVVFAGELIYEALSWWLGQTLQTRQDEKTLGISVSTYVNEYGQIVKVIPHRELLKNRYAGYAFSVDLADIKYKYLTGSDTYLVTGIQQPDLKMTINEFRTWFGIWIGNEKRHGVLKDVTTIAK